MSLLRKVIFAGRRNLHHHFINEVPRRTFGRPVYVPSTCHTFPLKRLKFYSNINKSQSSVKNFYFCVPCSVKLIWNICKHDVCWWHLKESKCVLFVGDLFMATVWWEPKLSFHVKHAKIKTNELTKLKF